MSITTTRHPALRPTLLGLLATMSLLGAGCATDDVAQTNADLAAGRAGDPGTGDPGTGTGGGSAACADILTNLDHELATSGKHYTAAELAALKAAAQHSFDVCTRNAVCEPGRLAKEKACGAKPPEGTPARKVFEACLSAAYADWTACMGPLLGDAP